MSLLITAECLNCGACEPECPNNAIYPADTAWTFGDGTAVKSEVEYQGAKVGAQIQQAALSEEVYFIVPEKCTECAGFHDDPQCVSVCPVDCIVEDPQHRESREGLLARKELLHA